MSSTEEVDQVVSEVEVVDESMVMDSYGVEEEGDDVLKYAYYEILQLNPEDTEEDNSVVLVGDENHGHHGHHEQDQNQVVDDDEEMHHHHQEVEDNMNTTAHDDTHIETDDRDNNTRDFEELHTISVSESEVENENEQHVMTITTIEESDSVEDERTNENEDIKHLILSTNDDEDPLGGPLEPHNHQDMEEGDDGTHLEDPNEESETISLTYYNAMTGNINSAEALDNTTTICMDDEQASAVANLLEFHNQPQQSIFISMPDFSTSGSSSINTAISSNQFQQIENDIQDKKLFPVIKKESQKPLTNKSNLAAVQMNPSKIVKYTKRQHMKRRLIVDSLKCISNAEFKEQLSDTSDIVRKVEIAPASKKAMQYLTYGGVGKFFAYPGRKILSSPLAKLFFSHLTITPTEPLHVKIIDGNIEAMSPDLRTATNSVDMDDMKCSPSIRIIHHAMHHGMHNESIAKRTAHQFDHLIKGMNVSIYNKKPSQSQYKERKKSQNTYTAPRQSFSRATTSTINKSEKLTATKINQESVINLNNNASIKHGDINSTSKNSDINVNLPNFAQKSSTFRVYSRVPKKILPNSNNATNATSCNSNVNELMTDKKIFPLLDIKSVFSANNNYSKNIELSSIKINSSEISLNSSEKMHINNINSVLGNSDTDSESPNAIVKSEVESNLEYLDPLLLNNGSNKIEIESNLMNGNIEEQRGKIAQSKIDILLAAAEHHITENRLPTTTTATSQSVITTEISNNSDNNIEESCNTTTINNSNINNFLTSNFDQPLVFCQSVTTENGSFVIFDESGQKYTLTQNNSDSEELISFPSE